MFREVWVLLIFVLAALAQGVLSEWHWSWSCQAGKCVKSESPTSLHTGEVTELSLAVCRLTCGRYGALWPHPRSATINKRVLPFNPSNVFFDLLDVAAATDYLYPVTDIFLHNIRTECGGNCTIQSDTMVNVYLVTNSTDVSLNWQTNEAYDLSIMTTGDIVSVTIAATTVYGARHGLETLSQLVAPYSTHVTIDETRYLTEQGLLIVTEAEIMDKPAFPHRGLLLDTARNFFPLSAIKRTIDGMGSSKLNVLHWHATDSQSFPLVSPRVPQLARFGAYSSRQVYTPADVADLLEYGRLRGVRVMLELDAPSHAGNGWQWGQEAGLGQLAVCVNQQPWRKYCIQPPCGQLNPANPNMYLVLRELYRDVLQQFPAGEILHMGGDEVFFACWNSSLEIVNWMESLGLGRTEADFLQVWAEFQNKALAIIDEETGDSKTDAILWSSHLTQPEIIENYLDKTRYVIETWVEANDNLPKDLLSKGYRVIFATKDAWYLDHGFWGQTRYHSWKKAYDNTLPRVPGALGGEAAMWTEVVDDNSLDVKVWPRAAAMAERLWSDPITDSLQAEIRLISHRQRLVTRGIRADALVPGWCVQNEGECS